MTERTIRMMAKEFAGAWYDRNERSEEFRKGEQTVNCTKAMRVKVGNHWVLKEVEFRIPMRVAFPTVEKYVESAWPHWVQYARERAVEMLTMSDERVSPILKDRIAAALIDENERKQRGQNKKLRQLTVDTQRLH